jgi:hypothetical protein
MPKNIYKSLKNKYILGESKAVARKSVINCFIPFQSALQGSPDY